MTIAEIKTVCFVGAGTMGCVNSLIAALAGYDVVLYDIAEDNLNNVPERHREIASFLVGNAFCTDEAVAEALQRISLDPKLESATAKADLVNESVFERRELKRQIHQKLDEVCPKKTILTTNTSFLLVSDIEDVVSRGDRFAALHAYLGSMLIDIVGGPRTSTTTIEILKRYVLSLGGNPMILKKEYPGYVMNAILAPLLMTAHLLVVEGLATTDEVDKAWMSHRKAPMGPFGMMDLFGLDLSLDNMQQEDPDPYIDKLKRKISPGLSPYVERGELGMKTGKGFYSYPNPAYQQPGFLDNSKDLSTVYHELISGLVQGAVKVVVNGVADFEDVDRVWMITTYLDAGPFGILDQMGIDSFLTIFETQVRTRVFPPEDLTLNRSYLMQFISRNELGESCGKGFYSYPVPEYKTSRFLRGTD